MLLDSYVDKDLNESRFQEAQKVGDLDTMWECVFFACTNIAKRIYANRGFIASEDDLHDVVMDSTMMVMRNILERGVKPEKLSAYCYLRVFCHCNGYGTDKFVKKLKVKLSNINDSYLQEYLEEELVSEEKIEEEEELDNNE